jgi:MFS family permease
VSLESPGKKLTTTEWLVLVVAAIGFLFDTYELLMFPVIGSQAISELRNVPLTDPQVRLWSGRMLWIAALCGGTFGLLGGWLIDRFGRKRIMAASIFLYSFSPVFAAFSTSLWMLILFRCTTFIGVCVELVAAVTWLSELFDDKRKRRLVLGWTLAFASVGGILVTEVFKQIVEFASELPSLPIGEGHNGKAAWRFTLLTGLVPGALILLLLPFVPESKVWADKKKTGTLRRPRFAELFAPGLRRTTIVATALSACGYAAAFGALQLTPLQMVPGLPSIKSQRDDIVAEAKEVGAKLKTAAKDSPEQKALVAEQAEIKKKQAALQEAMQQKRGDIQRWQELGGLTGRIVLAILLVVIVSHKTLLRVFLVPGLILFPVTYVFLFNGNYTLFAAAIFCCGLVTTSQFSYFGEYLPKAFPMHLRGTGGSFASNVGGRMIGTMAATLNTEFVSEMFPGEGPAQVAMAAAVIGGSVFFIALLLSFFLPEPIEDEV